MVIHRPLVLTIEQLTGLLLWQRLANTRGDRIEVRTDVEQEDDRLRLQCGEEYLTLQWTGLHWQPVH
jgi:hypothetical protein